MQEFDKVKDMVYCEIDEISRQGKLDINKVKVLGELVDILKDIGSVEMFEEGVQIQDEEFFQDGAYSRNNGGYSNGGYSNGGYSQRRMPIYYNEGNSYRGGRSMNGGYSRRGRGMYSYDDGKTQMIEKLHHLKNEIYDQNDKEAIQRLIDQMENS